MVYPLHWLVRPLALLLAAGGMGGCQRTYLGRFVTLRGIDVQDFRSLPSRPVLAGGASTPFMTAPEPMWMRRVPLIIGDRRISDAATVDSVLAANGTTAFIVLHRGQLVDERYYNGAGRDSLFKVFSITKSVLSALVGIAQAEGHLRVTDSLGAHLDLRDNPALAAITIEQLMGNVSGFRYRRGSAPWKEQPQMYYSTDVRRFIRDARVERTPGTTFDAEDLSPLLVGYALERALRRAGADSTLAHYAQTRLWQPMGAQHDALWNIDHDGDGLEKVESGLVVHALDIARFGQLYLDRGVVAGRSVVPMDWIDATIDGPPVGAVNRFTEGFVHRLWWGSTRAGRVRSDFYANGHFGQRVYVSPDKQLVLVRLGGSSGNVNWTQLLGRIADEW